MAYAQTLDAQWQCTQTRQEDGDGERLIFADQARIQLNGTKINAFQWESSQFRTSHGHECSIDTEDGLQAEVTEKGWRLTLTDAVTARKKRGYDFDRGYQCSIRLEREGDVLHVKPTCPALCGSRMNFSALSVELKTGQCRYDE
ncbi:hypothetical protein ACO0LB_14125 [Undibacterium sp. SXout7W]|uniref:hypothetical protein n=1 Tax=Undibacterium sp. SXout7W TaxID=3413049 RepID=UPI003BF3E0DE